MDTKLETTNLNEIKLNNPKPIKIESNNVEYVNSRLPLYFSPPRCYTCGRNISHVWVKYKKTIKTLTSNDYTTLPVRTINNKQLLSNEPKTREGTILDKNGLLLYCCRRMILAQPINKF